jgi:tRNA pseudouridine55 synthase
MCYKNAILLLDKPTGLTSNKALQIVRAIYDIKKAGHSGTLDPMASGMLVVCFNEATKFLQYIIKQYKTYQWTISLGVATSTGDSEGEIIRKMSVHCNLPQIKKVVKSFLGLSYQVPPMTSALKYKGLPLYKIARKGESVPIKQRQIDIKNIKVLNFANNKIELIATCSSGTYIRVLSEDIAKKLFTCGWTSSLRRLHVAPCENLDMFTLDKIKNADKKQKRSFLYPIEVILKNYQTIKLNSWQKNEIGYGRDVLLEKEAPKICKITDENNRFMGLAGQSYKNILKPIRLLKQYVN